MSATEGERILRKLVRRAIRNECAMTLAEEHNIEIEFLRLAQLNRANLLMAVQSLRPHRVR